MRAVTGSAEARRELVRLHLGCGSTVVPGWQNLDKSWNVYLARVPGARRVLERARVLTAEQASAVFPRGIVRADVRRGLPYPDGSAEYVYSSHMIEHLSLWQAREVVRECARVLAPGGLIRVATPDLAALVRAYVEGNASSGATPADSFMEQLLTFHERPGSLAQRLVRRLLTAPHQWLYDAASLSRLLEQGGFENPVARGFRESEMPDLDQLEDRPGSLFVEARRP